MMPTLINQLIKNNNTKKIMPYIIQSWSEKDVQLNSITIFEYEEPTIVALATTIDATINPSERNLAIRYYTIYPSGEMTGKRIRIADNRITNYYQFSLLDNANAVLSKRWNQLKEAVLLLEHLKGVAGVINLPVATNKVELGVWTTRVIKSFSVVIGFSSALKNYAGTESFFKTTAGVSTSGLVEFLLKLALPSAIAAGPSMFFNYDNLEKVSQEFVRYQRTRGVLPPMLERYQIEFDAALTQKFPRLETHLKRAFWEYVLKFILGVGYATANFGLVLDAFPNEFDYVGLKEFLLTAVWFTNFAIGYDKMDTSVNDIRKLFADRCETPVALADAEVLTVALQQFEKLVKQYKTFKGSAADQDFITTARATIKQKMAEMLSLRNVNILLTDIAKQVVRIQDALDERPVTTTDQVVLNITADDETLELNEHENHDGAPLLPVPIPNALHDPFYFRVLLPGEHPWAEKSLAVVSISISALAITSNVGGIASLSVLQPLGTILSYLIGTLGSWGAYSLNKGVTDDWTQRFLATLQTNVLKATNKKETFWSKCSPFASYQLIDYIGLAWSGYASTGGVYYTGNEIEKLCGTSWGARAFQYSAQAATAVMTTITKALPTARLLRPYVPTWCSGEQPDIKMTNKSLRDFYNLMISFLLEKIIALIEAYKKAVAQLSEMRQIRYGLNRFSYVLYLNQLNQHISRPNIERATVYLQLIEQYDVIREQVMTAYAALEISVDNSIGVSQDERRLEAVVVQP